MTNGATTKIVTSVLVAGVLAASSGAFLVYRELGEITSTLSAFERTLDSYGERLLWLERARRGLPPGEP